MTAHIFEPKFQKTIPVQEGTSKTNTSPFRGHSLHALLRRKLAVSQKYRVPMGILGLFEHKTVFVLEKQCKDCCDFSVEIGVPEMMVRESKRCGMLKGLDYRSDLEV